MGEDLKNWLEWVGGVCASIGSILLIYEKTVKKSIDNINAKIKDNTDRVTTLEKKHDEEVVSINEAIKKNHAKILNDNQSLERQQEMNGIIMRSLSAVTHHLVDGNHSEQLKESASEIDDFLFEKAKTIRERSINHET